MSLSRLRCIAIVIALIGDIACIAKHPPPARRSFGEAVAAATTAAMLGRDLETQQSIQWDIEELTRRCLDSQTETFVEYIESQPTALRGYLRLSSGVAQIHLCEIDARLLETGMLSKLSLGDDGRVHRERVFLLTSEEQAKMRDMAPAAERFSTEASDVSSILYGHFSDDGWRGVITRQFGNKCRENRELEQLIFDMPALTLPVP